jgi:cell division protein FtsQ
MVSRKPRRPVTPAGSRKQAPLSPPEESASRKDEAVQQPASGAAGRQAATQADRGIVRVNSGKVGVLPAETGTKTPPAAKPVRPKGRKKNRATFGAAGSIPDKKVGPAPRSTTVVAFPEPPGRKLRRRIWIGAAAAAVLVVALILVLVFSPVLAIKTITVTGTDLTSEKTVDEALAPLKEQPLPQVGDDDVRPLLEGLPAVLDVTVEARPPSELAVEITERIPVAVLETGKTFALIDAEGKRIGSVKERKSAELPLIDESAASQDQEIFRTITAVLSALPADILAQLEHASAKSIDSVELQLTNGQKVLWGNDSQLELKAKVFEALLNAPKPDVEVEVYDVSTPTMPVTR